MQRFFSFLLIGLLGLAQALSSSGGRLLVVIEDVAEKTKYSQFWDDLESTLGPLLPSIDCDRVANLYVGRGFKISFESPKNEKLSLFQHGERVYDHIILLPPKSKGTTQQRQ